MLRIPFIDAVYAAALALVLTLMVASTQIGGWIAHITLIFMPEYQQAVLHGSYSPRTLLLVLGVHFAWSLAAVLLYRKTAKPKRRPSESKK